MSVDLRAFRSDRSVIPGQRIKPLTTGSFLFDYVTGIGGLPRGRMVEAFGPESSGKSTAFYQAGVQAQRAGGVVLLLDYENSYTERYALQMGLDVSEEVLLVEQPFTLEEGFDKAVEVTEAFAAMADPPPLLVIFDSLAAIPMEGEAVDNNMAAAQRAKGIRSYLRKHLGTVARAEAIWAFVNHEMDNIFTGAPWEINRDKAAKGMTSTPGGRAVKYFSSQRYQFAGGAKLKGEVVDPVTGEIVDGFVAVKAKVTAVKNKLGAPFRSAELFIRYGAGIDSTFSLVDVGVKRRLIVKESKLTFVFPDGHKTTSGAAAAIEYLQSNPALAADIESQLRGLIESEWEKEQERLLSAAAIVATTEEVD